MGRHPLPLPHRGDRHHPGTPGGRLVFPIFGVLELGEHIFGALAEFERGIIRERTTAGLAAAGARGRVGGRPPKLKPADIRMAEAMLVDDTITIGEVAARPGIAGSTLYRHLPAPRSTVTRKQPA